MLSLPALLGINLWLITLVVPLLLSRAAPSAVSYFLLPFCPALLLLSLRALRGGSEEPPAWTSPALLIGVPLLCFLPVADGPLAEAMLHPRPAVVGQAAVFLGYLVVVCRRLAAAPTPDLPAEVTTTALDPGGIPAHWRRRIFTYRAFFVFSLALPLLLLYAINLHPGTLRALRLSFQGPARIGAVQAAVTAAAALLWVVTYHACLLSPLRSHLEHDRQAHAEIGELRRLARRGRPRPQFYVAMALALGSMIMLIWRSLHP